MKILLLTSAVLTTLSSFCFAQLPAVYGQDKTGKWGCSVAINSIQGQMGFPGITTFDLDENGNITSGGNKISKSFSLSVIPKYYIANDFLLRFEFGGTSINQQAPTDFYQTSVHHIGNDTVKESIIRFATGIQWNYVRKKFFEAYSGMSLIYMNYGKYSDNSSAEFRDSATNVLMSRKKTHDAIDGGFAGGVGAYMGFNIYLQKHISLGAEFSSSLLYYKVGGKYAYDHIDESVPNLPVTTIYNQTMTYKGFRFSNILSSFNISIWL